MEYPILSHKQDITGGQSSYNAMREQEEEEEEANREQADKFS
jgi:hypothetical protein